MIYAVPIGAASARVKPSERPIMVTSQSAAQRIARVLDSNPEQQAEIDKILTGAKADPPSAPLLLTFSEAARLGGFSRTTLWRMARAGVIQPVNLTSRCRRVRRSDIVRLAERGVR